MFVEFCTILTLVWSFFLSFTCRQSRFWYSTHQLTCQHEVICFFYFLCNSSRQLRRYWQVSTCWVDLLGRVSKWAFRIFVTFRNWTRKWFSAPLAGTSKKYFASKSFFKADFMTAFSLCRTSGMSLVTFRDIKETQDFVELFRRSTLSLTYVDGVSNTNAKDDWYSFDTGRPLNGKIPWHPGQPNGKGDENCLVVDGSGFHDYPCYHKFTFVCQEYIYAPTLCDFLCKINKS